MKVPGRNASTKGHTRNLMFDRSSKKDAMTESIDRTMQKRGENILGKSASKYDAAQFVEPD